MVPNTKAAGLFRYRTLNSSDVEEIEKSVGKNKKLISRKGKLNKVDKDSCSEATIETEKEKKKKRVYDIIGKGKHIHRDSHTDSNETDIETVEKLIDEKFISTPTIWKIIDAFFYCIFVLIKICILITLICISCDKNGKGCLACSTCENEKYQIDSIPLVGSIFGN